MGAQQAEQVELAERLRPELDVVEHQAHQRPPMHPRLGGNGRAELGDVRESLLHDAGDPPLCCPVRRRVRHGVQHGRSDADDGRGTGRVNERRQPPDLVRHHGDRPGCPQPGPGAHHPPLGDGDVHDRGTLRQPPALPHQGPVPGERSVGAAVQDGGPGQLLIGRLGRVSHRDPREQRAPPTAAVPPVPRPDRHAGGQRLPPGEDAGLGVEQRPPVDD